MNNPFKNEETKSLFIQWISGHPESEHPNDREQFYKFILHLLDFGDELNEKDLRDILKDKKEWANDEFINEFIEQTLDKYFLLKEFFDFLKENDRI